MAALVSEYTLEFFTLLNARGKKELIEWCMKEGLIASSYECPKCNEQMGLNERKSVVLDGFEWRCRKKGRGRNDSPYTEERTRSSNKNARRGDDQQQQDQKRKGACTRKSISLKVLRGSHNREDQFDPEKAEEGMIAPTSKSEQDQATRMPDEEVINNSKTRKGKERVRESLYPWRA
ncbi:uncharacterized protein TNCV_658651 [Trichonephila clavipes]|uniref:Uncharacterized protein n=1 Tax=Trichonephila clavipes TaxID=2585209 RepID=A0A8X6VG79_TRICX|nr:uncharacterized protein TNCV_658651 [Trichonephila clavipes]